MINTSRTFLTKNLFAFASFDQTLSRSNSLRRLPVLTIRRPSRMAR